MKIYNKVGSIQATYSDYNIGLRAGLIYRFNQRIGLGLSYASGPRFKAQTKFNPALTYGSGNAQKDYAGLADRLAMGAQFRAGMFALRATLAWMWFDPVFSNYESGWQYAFKLEAHPWQRLGFGLSFFTEQVTSNAGGRNPYVNWVSMAVRFRLSVSELALEAADSHIGSAEYYQQTVVRFAFNLPLAGAFGSPKELP